ncbi:UV-endonuclease UvdE [Powellomyces hirtus]|nr:UV-endonuclease UvdE [Powellomyces hirtus]
MGPTPLPSGFPYRLGYACLNSQLRNAKPPVFCSRTARIATIGTKGLEYVKELGRQNLADLEQLITWNEEHGIRFLRMSSDMFPFASHDVYGYDLTYCTSELQRVGALAKELDHRLTTHPGQTNNLGSPTRKVVEATKRDLAYHAQMMDLMELDHDSVMIIHMGGVYTNKAETIARFEAEFLSMPRDVRHRIVVENDEVCYNTEEILPTCERLGIPLVFDWHHHALNPGALPLDEILHRVKATWTNRGIRQKMHYSESRPGAASVAERRAHSDFVTNVPMCGDEVDLMIEAKAKEQAVFRIFDKYSIPYS